MGVMIRLLSCLLFSFAQEQALALSPQPALEMTSTPQTSHSLEPSSSASGPEDEEDAPTGSAPPEADTGATKGGDRPAEREAQKDESVARQFSYFGVGPAYLGIMGRRPAPNVEEYGLALSFGARHPLADHIAVNGSVSFGLTSWGRTEEWWGRAQRVGRWTKRAYGNVTEWAEQGEDEKALRYFAAFYAYVGLLFPYLASGIMYAVGPVAATSFVDFQMTASFHLLETRQGPYLEAGLGAMAYVNPEFGELKGGIGPSMGAGYDFGWLGMGVRGFASPRYLHGESSVTRTDVFTGTMLLKFQGK